jgi:hypothetical protein
MACTRRAFFAGDIADLHWTGGLLCALVSTVLGPESALCTISDTLDLCSQWRGAGYYFRAGIVEFVDCAQGCDQPQKQVRHERPGTRKKQESSFSSESGSLSTPRRQRPRSTQEAGRGKTSRVSVSPASNIGPRTRTGPCNLCRCRCQAAWERDASAACLRSAGV